MECADAAGAAVRGRFLEAFDAQDGPVADGQRTVRTWLVNVTRVTKAQAGEHRAVQALAREHPVLLAALTEGRGADQVGGAAGDPVDPGHPQEYRTRPSGSW